MDPLKPTLTAPLFPRLADDLLGLLRSLEPADWTRPTVCPAWTVRDIAAHLLDSACRRLSYGRDGLALPAAEIHGYRDLVALLNGLNAEWVAATRRLSPRLLTDLLAFVEPQLAEHFAGLDPMGAAPFPVAWAGETGSRSWFDVARELTERWHHQQQIRLAVGAQPLTDPELSEPVFDTFLRVLPHCYRDVAVPAEPPVALAVTIRGARDYAYTLRRGNAAWELLKGRGPAGAASITLGEEPAWLLLTNGMGGAEARARATVEGEAALLEPFFDALAVMA